METPVPGSGDKSQQQSPRQYRVLVIAPTSFFSDYGCSVRILEETRVLQRLGHKLTVCTYRNGQEVKGLSIRRTPSIPFRQHYEVGSSPHKIVFDLLLFWTVLFAALRHRPDIIHAHMHEGALLGLLIGRLLRIPLIFDFQGSLTGEMMDHRFLCRDSLLYRPLRWLERTIDHLSPVILTSSRNAKDALVTDFGCDPKKILPMADCVDATVFYPAQPSEMAALTRRRASLGIPVGRKVVVYLGLLADYQGTDALLHAVKHIVDQRDDVHFLVMGFPAVEHYENLAQQLGVTDHTTFTGKIPYLQARDHLAVGDIAVAPKLSKTEGNGKVLNYMAMGLPTVAFETPVSREYLGDAGLYAAAGDPLSLAQALLKSLSESPDAPRGQVLRQMAVEEYSWDQAGQTILRAYELVCHG